MEFNRLLSSAISAYGEPVLTSSTPKIKSIEKQNPIKYPIVGPVKYKSPTPFSGELENTGNPIIPSNKYNPIVANPTL